MLLIPSPSTTVSYHKFLICYHCSNKGSAFTTAACYPPSKKSSRFSSKKVSSKCFLPQRHSPLDSICPQRLSFLRQPGNLTVTSSGTSPRVNISRCLVVQVVVDLMIVALLS